MGRDIRDRTIAITGASSGIGAATAVACAAAGMDVVLGGRRAVALERIAARVRESGRTAEVVVGDVTDAGMSARLLDAAGDRLYAVFANAGYGIKAPTHELADAELRRVFEVNFFAAVDLLREAARRLLAAQRPGHLLMCSSCVAHFTTAGFAAYSASKAAQHHVCRSMRMDLHNHRIQVSSVHPISTRTEFFNRAAAASADQPTSGHLPDDPAQLGGPKWLQQPPERVARGVVSCLRRPRPEVWTSLLVRVAAATFVMFPRTMDLLRRF